MFYFTIFTTYLHTFIHTILKCLVLDPKFLPYPNNTTNKSNFNGSANTFTKLLYQPLPGMGLHFRSLTSWTTIPLCQGLREPNPDKAPFPTIIVWNHMKNSIKRSIFNQGQFGFHPLSLPVLVCVLKMYVGINPELVHAIIHHPFKLGSANSDHRCKVPWLIFLLFSGANWSWPSRTNLT